MKIEIINRVTMRPENSEVVTSTSIQVEPDDERLDTVVLKEKREYVKQQSDRFNSALVVGVLRHVRVKDDAPDVFDFSFTLDDDISVVDGIKTSLEDIDIEAILQGLNGEVDDGEDCACPVCAMDGSLVAVVGLLAGKARKELERIDVDEDEFEEVFNAIFSNAERLEKSTSLFMDDADVLEDLKQNYLPSPDSESELSGLSRDLILNLSALLRSRAKEDRDFNRGDLQVTHGVIVLYSLYQLDEEAFWRVFDSTERDYAEFNEARRRDVKGFMSFVLCGLMRHISELSDPFAEYLGDREVEFAGSKAANLVCHPHLIGNCG